MAIGITVKKAPERYDLGASKFFGTPTVPAAWEDTFGEDEIFFCQIHLADVAPFDTGSRLPHSGYLYVFLHTEGGNLTADVRYHDGEPTLAFDGFNAAVDGYEQFDTAYLMAFSEAEGDAACTRLLGVPSDWPYGQEPPALLMQFDPLDGEMGFLDRLDGFVYLFFGENGHDLDGATLHMEYS